MPVPFEGRIDRVREDLGHALNGHPERISRETQRDVAEAIRNHMEGRNRVEIPINPNVTLEGRRERDGTVIGSIRFDF